MAWWDRKPGRINNQEPDADAETIVYDAVTLPPGTESTEQNTIMSTVTTNAQSTNAAQPVNTAPATVEQEQHPVLTAALAAGINTAEAFASLRSDADAHRASVGHTREEAKKRVIALYGNNAGELAYQNAILESLPTGDALNTHLEKLNADYDKAFPQNRTSAPNELNTQTPRVAVDATGKVETKQLSQEQQEQATQQTLASY